MGPRAATFTITIGVLILLGAGRGRAAPLEPCQTNGSALVELGVEQGRLVVRQTVHLIRRSDRVTPDHGLRQHGLQAEQLISAELLFFDRATTADEVFNHRVKPSERIDLGDATTYERVTRVLRIGRTAGSRVAELLGGDAPSRALTLTYVARPDRLTDTTARFRFSLGLPVTVSQKVGEGYRHAPLLCGNKLHVRVRLELPSGVKGEAVSGFSNYAIRGEPIVTDTTWGLDEVIELRPDPPLAVWIDLPRQAVPGARGDPLGVAALRFLYGDRSYAGVAPRIALSLLILVGLVWARSRGRGAHAGSYVFARVFVGNLALLAPLWLGELGLIHIQRFGFIEGTIVYGTWAIDALYLIPIFLATVRPHKPGRRRREPAEEPARVDTAPARPIPLPAARESAPAAAPAAEEENEDGSSIGEWNLSIDTNDVDRASESGGELEGLWDDSPDIGSTPDGDEERR
jgi:hypothetical protein